MSRSFEKLAELRTLEAWILFLVECSNGDATSGRHRGGFRLQYPHQLSQRLLSAKDEGAGERRECDDQIPQRQL